MLFFTELSGASEQTESYEILQTVNIILLKENAILMFYFSF